MEAVECLEKPKNRDMLAFAGRILGLDSCASIGYNARSLHSAACRRGTHHPPVQAVAAGRPVGANLGPPLLLSVTVHRLVAFLTLSAWKDRLAVRGCFGAAPNVTGNYNP